MKIKRYVLLGAFFGFLSACEKESEIADDPSSMELEAEAPVFMELKNNSFPISGLEISEVGKFSEHGELELAIYSAEYLTSGDKEEVGNTVYFLDTGNKQLGADFVPGYSLDGTSDISYYTDSNRASVDLDVSVTTAAIERAMSTWKEITCSEIGLHEIPYDGRPTGLYAQFLGFGGSGAYVADVVHAGWLPGGFFDFLAQDGSQFILGVTFTLIFTSAGVPTDMDNNGKADVAFREIYYNDAFSWNDGGTYDVETIALHEAGHGLSQGHFGKAFRTESNSKIHFAPRAVMNAAYSGVQTSILQTDNAGHCSNWSSWPKN